MTPDEIPAKEIGLISGALGGLGLLWHAYRRVRTGMREDGASETTAGTYKAIIDAMEAQITRLETRVDTAEKRANELEQRVHVLNQRVTDEIQARYAAEFTARRLEGERNALRAELDDMKGKGWEHGGV